jgi:ferredoxin
MVKIKQDREKCIGCGACVSVCPSNWEFDGPKAKPKKTEVDDLGCNKEAADICPVNCITIEE